MKRPVPFLISLFATIFITSIPVAASVCEYSTSPDGQTQNAHYDVGRAYQAADAVVVGRVTEKRKGGGQALKISQVVKSPNAGALTYPGQPESDRPVYEGVRLPGERDFVLLLRAEKGGRYASVDGQPDVCPVIFPVADGYARIGNQAVALERLEKFFESRPEAIAFP